jgi:hypothetical protein
MKVKYPIFVEMSIFLSGLSKITVTTQVNRLKVEDF